MPEEQDGPLDLDSLTLDELLDLNETIVKRIEYLYSLKTRANLDRFQVGDKVSWQLDEKDVEGVVVRVNQKSVSVKTEDGYWRLHPRLLTKLTGAASTLPADIRKILKGE